MNITFYILYTPEYLKYTMGMGIGMGIDSENPMGMGVGMGMTFENRYGCKYSYTCPTPIPRLIF